MTEKNLLEKFNSGQVDRRTFLKVAGVLGGATIFGLPWLGCQSAAPAKKSFDLKAAEPSRMVVYSPYYVAQQKGFFQDVGVPSEWTVFAGGGDQVRAILGGGFHLGIGALGAAAAAYEAGEPVRLLASMVQGGGAAILVRSDSPYKKPEDLKGKKFKIGHSRPNSNTHFLNMLSLKQMGIDANDKELVTLVASGNVNETWTAVKTGVIDLGWSSEPQITQIEKSGEGRVLFSYWDMVPDWIDGVAMTSQQFIDSNPKEIEAWLSACAKGVEWVKGNRAEAAKIIAQYLEVPEDIAAEALKKMPDKAWPVAMSQKALDFSYQVMKDFNQVKGTVKWDEFAVRKFLPSNLRNA